MHKSRWEGVEQSERERKRETDTDSARESRRGFNIKLIDIDIYCGGGSGGEGGYECIYIVYMYTL